MLTYTKELKPKRKDRPWILFVLVMIWIIGTAFFHSPWEPYEPFVLAVVKGILWNHSWVVPYVSGIPYLDIQPFYFWIYAAILKLLNIDSVTSIVNAVRIINTLVIFTIVAVMARIGFGLSAYKNGRSVVLILISLIGFINNAYQLSPNIWILLGFSFFIYALQLYRNLPGISGWLLFIGLLLTSINFTCEFVGIALVTLLILPIVDRGWRNRNYLFTTVTGIVLFAVMFYLYCYQLQKENSDFFNQWCSRYTYIYLSWHNLPANFVNVLVLLSWYVLPAWLLMAWTFYKRRSRVFQDKTVVVAIVLSLILLLVTLFDGRDIESLIFPIVLPCALLASLEIDTIRINIVSFCNWFATLLFGTAGIAIWAGYFVLVNHYPKHYQNLLLTYCPSFFYRFSIWRLILAIIVTIIWLVMIVRRYIRGREVLSNWASGTTFVLVLFMALSLPWFDAMLTFRPIVDSSLKYIDKSQCIATNGTYTTQGALWYYFANVNLMPSFTENDFGFCNQALVATTNVNQIDQNNWKILWRGKRLLDKKVYYIIRHR